MRQERPDGWVQGILCGLCRFPPERLNKLQEDSRLTTHDSQGEEFCHGHDLTDIVKFWPDTSTLVLADNRLATDVLIMVRR